MRAIQSYPRNESRGGDTPSAVDATCKPWLYGDTGPN